MKKFIRPKKGFTLIEMLVYIALATMVIGILFAYGWNVVSARVKANTMRETMASGQVMSEILRRDIRSASGVDQGQSIFNSAPGKLVLNTPDGDITIESNGDMISIKRGGAQPEALHSNLVRIRNLKFIAQVSDVGTVQYVGFSFTAEAHYATLSPRSEYDFSIPFSTGAEMRNQ